MSKKPLIRSKKRAVHTNTKDKLSKLIVEVDSIAKELSKVKKGGGFSFSGSKKENFFTKIGNMLNTQKKNIINIKYEFIDLLIDSHIKSLNNNYVSEYSNSTFKISQEINNLITNLISTQDGQGIYGYEELNVNNITQIQKNGEDSDNIVNMKKIAHILNIIRYLYQEVKDDSGNIDITTSFDKKTHYTDSKINQILFGSSNNNKDFRYQFMDDKKNELMKKIFNFVSNITSGNQPGLITSIKTLYESINNKKIFEYLPKLEILANLESLGNLDNANDIYNDIKLLKRIRLKYDIYTKIICPELTNNLFIHEESDTKNKSFEFLNNYKILEDSNIKDIITLKEAIKKFKLENIISKDEGDRKKSSTISRTVSFLTRNKKEMRPINDILLKLKTDLDTLRTKNKSFVSDSTNIRKDSNIIDIDKKKKLKALTEAKEDLEKIIGNDIKIFNNIKDELIIKYKAEHADNNEDRIYKEFNAYFQEKIKSLNFEKEDIEKFNLNEELVEPPQAASEGGKLAAKYKSTGESVYILYKKKKIKRCVYEKTKGRGKYCKIDGEYKLLSKLKIM
jgi:hypothetical protein